MFEVPISIKNPHDFPKTQELFEIGVPFPKGAIQKEAKFRLVDDKGELIAVHASRELAQWSDQSSQWVMLSFSLDLQAGEKRHLCLSVSGTMSSCVETERVDLLRQPAPVSVLGGKIIIDPACFSPLGSMSGEQEKCYRSNMVLTLEGGNTLVPNAGHCDRLLVRDAGNESFEQLTFEGQFQSETDGEVASGLKFLCVSSVYPASRLLKVDFTLWNSNAAQHPGGCWDLGDSASKHLKSLVLSISSDDGVCHWRTGASEKWLASESFSLTQTGSGAQSARHFNVHKDRDANVHDFFNGFQVNESGNQQAFSGGRANPELYLGSEGKGGLSAVVQEFWQNFPKSVRFESSDESKLVLDLFPAEGEGESHELQGGERKTHTLYFALDSDLEDLSWVNNRSHLAVSTEWLAKTKVLPYLSASPTQDPFAELIKIGIEGDQSFCQKREVIDEYGWRNFGDIYADHETLYQSEGEAPFVSHYNNQYDGILGYARQYLQTGDHRWFELMDELARHVRDIDIYHTDEDRVEYNRGLFWHTDHYLDAATCTHRTFTKYSDTSSTPGQTGGGPGSEHCYTTGLMYHYYLTGSQTSKDAVLGMADWMISIHDGAPSLLAQVLSAKNNELKTLIQLLKGNSPLPYRYPFTRGTGNFITALLDAYSLSGDTAKLARAESVIRESLHPKDDISLRDLGNIEDTWSYVVLLQAVSKYLSTKEALELYDESYFYAKESLLHYVDWMAENEKPYLSREGILEFPNDTWVAQEMRKLNLLISGAMYSVEKRAAYLARASEFLNYIVKTLSDSPEKHFSRIQILLLQNYGPHFYCQDSQSFETFDQSTAGRAQHNFDFGEVKKLSRSGLVFAIIKKLFKGLGAFSIQREKQWVNTRRG